MGLRDSDPLTFSNNLYSEATELIGGISVRLELGKALPNDLCFINKMAVVAMY